MSMQQLKETMELLHKGGAVPLNVVKAVNDLLTQVDEYGTLIEQQGKEMIRLQQLANKQGKELEEKEILLSGRRYTINRLKEQNEEIATMGIRQGEQIYRLLQSEKKQYKELERLRIALETTLFHLKKEYYMSAEDSIEEALAVGQEGEGNQ